MQLLFKSHVDPSNLLTTATASSPHHHHRFTSIFPHKSAGWTSPTNFMLDLMLTKYIKNRIPFRFRRSGLFPRPNKGPFLRDSVLLFGLVGELTISQNHHHEGTKEQIGRPP